MVFLANEAGGEAGVNAGPAALGDGGMEKMDQMSPHAPNESRSTGLRPSMRSRTGCLVCRRRKKRCDQKRPTCDACLRLNLSCEYPPEGQERMNRRPHKGKQVVRVQLEAQRSPYIVRGSLDDHNLTTKQYRDYIVQCNWRDHHGSSFDHVLPRPDLQQETLLEKFPFESLDLNSSLTRLYEPSGTATSSDELKYLYQQQDEFNRSSPLAIGENPPLMAPTLIPKYIPLTLSDFPHLAPSDTVSAQLLSYFQTHLAPLVCVSPKNHYLSKLLPMAQFSKPVLYSLLAWSAVHRGLCDDIGASYLRLAIHSIQEQTQPSLTTPTTSITPAITTPTEEILTAIILMCTAEICRGDVVKWDKRLRVAADLIRIKGGVLGPWVTESSDSIWLVRNFAYHDILSASANARGGYFNYEELFAWEDSELNPLLGCCGPLIPLLAKVASLGIRSKQLFQGLQQQQAFTAVTILDGNDGSFDFRSELKGITCAADNLFQDIDNCHPGHLPGLDPHILELQLTVFETFQIAIKLHLQQLVLRYNAASLEIQVLVDQLLISLDIVMNTQVEGMLCFPLFIAGICTTSQQERMKILDRLDGLYKRHFARNTLRVKQLLQEVWQLDSGGTGYVDWYEILRKRGWDISFC